MKKLIATVMALILVAAMSTSVFAFSDTLGAGENREIAVNAKYTDSVDTPEVYSVDVTWGEMQFTYSVSGTKMWNPATHDFDISTTDSWSANDNEITVTNHSNAEIKADFTYASKVAYSMVTGTLSNDSITLPSAEGKTLTDDSLVGKTALTLGGTLPDTTSSFENVGAVTVAISKA